MKIKIKAITLSLIMLVLNIYSVEVILQNGVSYSGCTDSYIESAHRAGNIYKQEFYTGYTSNHGSDDVFAAGYLRYKGD